MGLWLILLPVLVVSCASAPSNGALSTASPATLLAAPADTSNALFGFVATDGHWVVEPRFQDAHGFSEGLAAVELNGKWGYVNIKGIVAIPAQFTEAHEFENGMARVAVGPAPSPDDRFVRTASAYGFVGTSGKLVIPATWDDAGDFSEGLAPVMKGSACGFINAKGKLVIPLRFDLVTRFSEGLAAACQDGKWGYVDKSGVWAIQPQFDGLTGLGVIDDPVSMAPGRFQNGLAPVTSDEAGGGWRYVDKTGRSAFPAEFQHAGEFNEGLAPVQVDGYWGFINRSGEVMIRPQFRPTPYFDFDQYLSESQGFHQGLAAVANADGMIGYIDTSGRYAIQPAFAFGSGFVDGFAYVYPGLSSANGGSAMETGSQLGPLSIIDLRGQSIYVARPSPATTESSAR